MTEQFIKKHSNLDELIKRGLTRRQVLKAIAAGAITAPLSQLLHEEAEAGVVEMLLALIALTRAVKTFFEAVEGLAEAIRHNERGVKAPLASPKRRYDVDYNQLKEPDHDMPLIKRDADVLAYQKVDGFSSFGDHKKYHLGLQIITPGILISSSKGGYYIPGAFTNHIFDSGFQKDSNDPGDPWMLTGMPKETMIVSGDIVSQRFDKGVLRGKTEGRTLNKGGGYVLDSIHFKAS